jgi:para-aminobenzoate synthetase/4-amino-4-deoxychorismate lyase
LIETLLWDGEYFLLEGHLERLAASAAYFDFRCDLDKVREALNDQAASFPVGARLRVRFTLARSGALTWSTEPVQVSDEPARLLLSSERTESTDRFLRHKTTQRALYDRAWHDARSCGFDDMLFLNQRGEVTECGGHNILIEKQGMLLTPPLDCGVLPGVFRAHLLATRPEIREAVLTLDDLLAADRIFICNSVRGLRPVSAICLGAGDAPVWQTKQSR